MYKNESDKLVEFYIGKGTGDRMNSIKDRSDEFMKIYNNYECVVEIVNTEYLNEMDAFYLEACLINDNFDNLTNLVNPNKHRWDNKYIKE